MTTRNRRHQAARMAGLAASLALALTGCAAPDSPPGPTQTSQAPSASARPTAERRYDDGTYTADGWYGSQPSRIGVTLTLADSRITAVQITTPATDPTSLGSAANHSSSSGLAGGVPWLPKSSGVRTRP